MIASVCSDLSEGADGIGADGGVSVDDDDCSDLSEGADGIDADDGVSVDHGVCSDISDIRVLCRLFDVVEPA